MTPHEFCHWLRGYLEDPMALRARVQEELQKVDMTSFFLPPIPDDDKSPPPSSPPAPPSNLSRRGHYGTINGHPIPAPMIQTPLN